MDSRTHPRCSCVGSGPQLLLSCTGALCCGDVLNNVPLLPKISSGDEITTRLQRVGSAVRVELW